MTNVTKMAHAASLRKVSLYLCVAHIVNVLLLLVGLFWSNHRLVFVGGPVLMGAVLFQCAYALEMAKTKLLSNVAPVLEHTEGQIKYRQPFRWRNTEAFKLATPNHVSEALRKGGDEVLVRMVGEAGGPDDIDTLLDELRLFPFHGRRPWTLVSFGNRLPSAVIYVFRSHEDAVEFTLRYT